jgi:hypothetical protein
MKDMEELHFWIFKDDYDPVADSAVFDPMRAITRLQKFEVALTWTPQYDWTDVPFQLGRPAPEWYSCIS